jgi:hypothetical protein
VDNKKSALGSRRSVLARLEIHFQPMARTHEISRVREPHKRQVVGLKLACHFRTGPRGELYYKVLHVVMERWKEGGWVLLLHDDVDSDSDPSAISGGFPASEKDNNRNHNNAIVPTKDLHPTQSTKNPMTCCELIIFSVATTGSPFSMDRVTVLAVTDSRKSN